MPQDVHRLKDIQVEEVSLVDRAANKRRFLLVKRDGDMDLKPNGRGGFTRVAKADEDEAEKARKAKEAEDEEKRKAAAGGGEAEAGAGGADEEDEADKAKKQLATLEAAGVDVSAIKAIFAGDKKKARKADASGKALAEELAGHVEAIEELIEQLGEHEDEEPSDSHMEKLAGMHKDLGSTIGKFKKGGAPKTEKRGVAFTKALDTLQSLLGELLETPAKAKEHDAEPGDPQGSPKGWSPSNPSGVPTGEAGTAGGFVGKALASEVAQLTQLVKRQATEIESLKKGVVPSNSRGAEARVKKNQPADAAWPMDMNDDRYDRAKVDKSTSFFADEE